MINRKFLQNWIPIYKNESEIEYEDILKKIQENDLYIDWAIFKRIYDWKASRSKKYIVEKNKELYLSAFKEIYDLKDEEKIYFFKETKHRKKLPGILEPVASTILHFIYPNKFPIRDVRTVGTLTDKGLLRKRKISYKDYKTEIFKIYNNCKREFSLRKIDRALFTNSEEKELLSRVLRGKNVITDIAIHLKNPQERRLELIMDLENSFKANLVKLDNLKKEITR
ncbi:hypothetical protein LCGC14_1533420 [marine sediment metagenome]|uniref:Uncharacterized protein n=1 Tax=marine sediment metagenome TaxID=412755 RepID=A0A0F9IVC1_9ZZZZ